MWAQDTSRTQGSPQSPGPQTQGGLSGNHLSTMPLLLLFLLIILSSTLFALFSLWALYQTCFSLCSALFCHFAFFPNKLYKMWLTLYDNQINLKISKHILYTYGFHRVSELERAGAHVLSMHSFYKKSPVPDGLLICSRSQDLEQILQDRVLLLLRNLKFTAIPPWMHLISSDPTLILNAQYAYCVLSEWKWTFP